MIKLRIYRMDRGWTQEEVAKRIGVTKVTIHDLETGKRRGSVKVWDALEDLFQIPQRQLRDLGDKAATPNKSMPPSSSSNPGI